MTARAGLTDAECDALHKTAFNFLYTGAFTVWPHDVSRLLRAGYTAGAAAASVPREQLREQLEQAYRNGAVGRKCYCGALILGKGGQTGQHCGDCNAAIGSM
jgi:hypothetical protein